MPTVANRFAVLLGFLCLAQTTPACLQGSEPEQRHETARDQLQQARELSALALSTPLRDAGRPYVADPALSGAARYEAEALHHVLSGRAADAVPLLIAAEKTSPGRYSVAANLGTAHELNGQNQAALRWIREAIARNPDSHAGTEWVHVAILDAKVRRERTPDTPFKPLIPLPENFDAETPVAVLGARHSVSEVKRAVHYQLRERMKFVKPRDSYVADLLFTLSVIDGRLYGPESAYEYVRLAESYGHENQAALEAAKRAYLPLIRKARLLAGAAEGLKLFGIGTLLFLTLKVSIGWITRFVPVDRSSRLGRIKTGANDDL